MTSLARNREFNLLWTSQAFSDLGGAIAQLAVPLLVLALTGSAVQAGLVGTVAQIARLLTRLPAGVLADRLNRRTVMLTCDAVRLMGFAGLAAAVATGRAGLTVIIVVAVLDAGCGALFQTAEQAALRSIVPLTQLSAAVARNEARSYGTGLAGPPLGGLLFGIAHAVPFAANTLSCLFSLAGVLLIRKPLQAERAEAPAGHGAALLEGLRFVFGNPFLRVVLVIAAPLNLALNGAIFAIILSLQRHGVTPAVIGLVETIVGAGGLIGAFLAPALQRRLGFTRLVRVICWTTTGVLAISALLTTSILAAVPVAVAVFLGPACNAAIFGYQAAITPDRLQGRVVSVIFTAAMSASALAPILAGTFVTTVGGPATILFFAAAVSVSALAATVARGIREIRPVEEIPA